MWWRLGKLEVESSAIFGWQAGSTLRADLWLRPRQILRGKFICIRRRPCVCGRVYGHISFAFIFRMHLNCICFGS